MFRKFGSVDFWMKYGSRWIFGCDTSLDSLYLSACDNSFKVLLTWNYMKVLVTFFAVILSFPGFASCDPCLFPTGWTGAWFQKGTQDAIRIYNGTISDKGTCRDVDGDKFLIENTLEKCFRCVVLHEKHKNVLQYKETHCSQDPLHQRLENLCSEINGDALLYSMFRLHTPAVPCPFKGSYVFSYSRGHRQCAYPMSTIDSCTQDSHLLLRFQACADVIGSESRVEELVCLATWKEGSTRYLVGKLEHRVAKANEDKFRCFVYEQDEDGLGYQVAQSGDATCDGLFSATEGSRTMLLKKANHPHAKCTYPEWFTMYRHWRVLDGRFAYDIYHKNASFRVSNATTGDIVKRVVCIRDTASSPDSPTMLTTTPTTTLSYVQYVVHVTSGCNSGYACLRIHKRAPRVVEIQTSHTLSTQPSDACRAYTSDFNPSEIVTLTTLTSGSLECPLAGIYSVEGNHLHLSRLIFLNIEEIPLCTGTTMLTSGCSAVDKMELLHDCMTEKKIKTFQCRGSWEENGTNYVIATEVGTRQHLCLAYTQSDKVVHFSGSMEACLRSIHPGKEGQIAMNGTSKGLCHSTDGAISTRHANYYLGFILVALSAIVTFCVR